jgi:hypothetical protein
MTLPHPFADRYPQLCHSLAALGLALPHCDEDGAIRFEAGLDTGSGDPSYKAGATMMSLTIMPSAGALLVLETRISGLRPGRLSVVALQDLLQGLGALAFEPDAGIVTYVPAAQALLLQHWFDPLMAPGALRELIHSAIARTGALRTYLFAERGARMAARTAVPDVRGTRTDLKFSEATFRAR